MGSRALLGAIIAVAGFSLAGCNEEPLSIRITLDADGSGTIKVISVAAPDQAGAAERGSRGARWSDRVSVSAESGAFADLAQLAVADITFQRALDRDMGLLDVIIPLGTHVQWVADLAPLAEADRTRLAGVFDPAGRARSIGASLRIEIELPGRIVSSGAMPGGQGIMASHEGTIATLNVPVGATVQYHDTVRWHVAWIQ